MDGKDMIFLSMFQTKCLAIAADFITLICQCFLSVLLHCYTGLHRIKISHQRNLIYIRLWEDTEGLRWHKACFRLYLKDCCSQGEVDEHVHREDLYFVLSKLFWNNFLLLFQRLKSAFKVKLCKFETLGYVLLTSRRILRPCILTGI